MKSSDLRRPIPLRALLNLSLPFVVMAQSLAAETPAVIDTHEIATLISPHGWCS